MADENEDQTIEDGIVEDGDEEDEVGTNPLPDMSDPDLRGKTGDKLSKELVRKQAFQAEQTALDTSQKITAEKLKACLLYTSPSPRDS